MMKNILALLLLSLVGIGSTFGCDGFTVNAITQEFLGGVNGTGTPTYMVTISYCESVSNGAGSTVHGIRFDVTGASIIGTTTPSITSNATGVTMDYSLIGGSAAEWGDWDNDNAPAFMNDGDPEECFTLTLLLDGPASSVQVAASSDANDLGQGFQNYLGRWTCIETANFSPPVCNASWTPPSFCAGDNTTVDLNTTTSGGGTWSGPGVNGSTFDPTGFNSPVDVTLTINQDGFLCSSTQAINISSGVVQSIDLSDQTICEGQSADLGAVVNTGSLPDVSGSNNTSANIPDNVSFSNALQSVINLSGITGAHMLESVCLDITHDYTDDIRIRLYNPCGDFITLVSQEGGSGDNFSGTCFTLDASTNISGQNAPFSGDFVPNDPFSSLDGCGDGDWTLVVRDDETEDCFLFCTGTSSTVGTLNSWSINFTAGGSYTTSWSPTTNMTNSTTDNPTVTPPLGTHTYTITTTDNNGCTFTEDVDITVESCVNCLITNFTTNIGACQQATQTYDITGVVEFTNAPTTGTLTISTDCGNSDTYSAPFTSPINYTITGNNADGTMGCNVTAVFSDDPACTQTLPYDAPGPCLVPCNFTYMFIDRGACEAATNTFDMTVDLEFENQPTTGTLTVSDCNGNSVTLNAPFVSPLSVLIEDIPTDGTQNCTVTAVFSDDPACTISLDINYPNDCSCTADVGTFNETVTGNTNSVNYTYDLCFNDQLDIIPAGDWTPPTDLNDPTYTYDPDIWLLAFSCPPTHVFPDNPSLDPCFLGYIAGNGGGWFALNDLGDNSTIYFQPITAYSTTDNLYSLAQIGADPCFETGPVYQINNLQEITYSVVEDCSNGTVSITMNGGYPGFDPTGIFTATVASPGTATVTTNDVGDGGTLVISGLLDGDNYTIDVTDNRGCPIQITGGPFEGPRDAAFDYTDAILCQGGPNPLPNITGEAGGTFSSSNAAILVNTTTGEIDLTGSAIGTTTVSYTVNGACPATETFDITIIGTPVADFDIGVYCNDAASQTPSMINGGVNGDWTSTAGLVIDGTTGEVDVMASTPGTYTITNTVSAAGCGTATFDDDITIYELPTGTLTGDATVCDGVTPPDMVLTADAGTGDWTATINTPTGTDVVTITATPMNYPVTSAGAYELVSITDANGCTQTLSDIATITINPIPTYNPPANISVCEGVSIPTINLDDPTYNVDGADLTWTSSNTSIGIGASGTTAVNGFVSANGTGLQIRSTQTVTPSLNGCTGIPATFDIVINVAPAINFEGDDLNGCVPHTTNFTELFGASTTASCAWDFGDGNVASSCNTVSHTYNDAGCFDVTLTVEDQGCVSTITRPSYVCTSTPPEALFTPNPTVISTVSDGYVNMINLTQYSDSVIWFFGDGYGSNEFSPSHNYDVSQPDTMIVTLIASNADGCVDTARANVIIQDVVIYYVPNVFTPNGDSYNNTFTPVMTQGVDPQNYTLYVFNRWGELIFESNDPEVGWSGLYYNGTEAQDGVYVWKIEFKDNIKGEYVEDYGHVTLLR